jgi:Zn-dependent protease with chaperone function
VNHWGSLPIYILSCIGVLVHAVSSLLTYRIKLNRVEVLQRLRWQAFAAVVYQVTLAAVLLDSSVKNAGAFAFLVFLNLAIHGRIEFALEKKIRGIKASFKESSRLALRGIFGVIALYLVYFLAIGFFAYVMLQTLHFFKMSGWVDYLTYPISVFIGLYCITLFSPFLLRIMLPCNRLKDPKVEAVIDACFERAQLPKPSYWVINIERFNLHNAMVAGLPFGEKSIGPALFFTKSLVEKLTPAEFEAVLLHEISHLKLRHNFTRMLAGF